MNRKESLDFIRQNSRCVVSMYANKPGKWEQEEQEDQDFNKSIFEHRLGMNGKPFILHDFGTNGWDIYFISGSNEVAKTIQQFAENTGCQIPEPSFK